MTGQNHPNPSGSARIEELFHAVADMSPEDRRRYFAARNIEPDARQEVEELLAFDAPLDCTLETDIGQVAQRMLGTIKPEPAQCGPYRLGDALGSGGMGTVYRAERIDGEVAQRVAVKLLRAGADFPLLRRRFLAERQILANLSHPNIARLLDAGRCDTGQPYLVMECVEGRSIDLYAEGRPLRQKLTVFLKVCGAVSYLHRNLVIHRDLKPGNILVDRDGEPKLLDFGIAKLLNLEASGQGTSNTRILTPDFASPEQVAGGLLTTATDTYSLGAVLYKLLTGASPHRFAGDSAEAIAQAIASGRTAPPSKLSPGVKGDLELVVMKALRKEPHERYASVEQFAEDIENYLARRPIRARKGDFWYRTRKFLRRNWMPAAAIALAVSSLSAGLVVANQQRAVAQRRFTQVRQLANKLFEIDAEVRRSPGTTKARELIVSTSLEYLRRVSAEVHGDPDLELDLGSAYMRVARVEGVPVGVNLGHMDQAEQNLRIAERFMQSVLSAQPANRTAMLRSAQIAHDRMLLARLNGRDTEAVSLADQSARWLERYHAGTADAAEAGAILNLYVNVADQYVLGRRFDDALRWCARGMDLARLYSRRPYIGSLLWISAHIARSRGDLDEALLQFRQSAQILAPDGGESNFGQTMNYISARIYEARVLGELDTVNLGRTKEAAAILENCLHIADQVAHKDPRDQNSRGRLATAGLGLADILREANPVRSLQIYDHVLFHLAEIGDNASFRRFEASALTGASYPLRRLGRSAEARQRLDAAFDRLRQVKAYPAQRVKPGSEPDAALSALAAWEAGRGKPSAAIEIYGRLITEVEAWQPQPEADLGDAVNLSRIYGAMAALNRRLGAKDRADALEARNIELWRRWEARLPGNAFVAARLSHAREPAGGE